MKNIIITVLAAFLAVSANAQVSETPEKSTDSVKHAVKSNFQNKHEFFFGGSGALQSLQYSPTAGDHKLSAGFNAGLGYTFFFNYNWGISLGAEFSYLQGKTVIAPSASGTYLDTYLIDSRAPFDRLLTRNTSALTERQLSYYINIPLLARYEFAFPKNNAKISKFYTAAGIKVGIPVYSAYNLVGDIETSGLVENKLNNTRDILTDQPNHGFTTYSYGDNSRYEGKFAQNVNVIGTVELGVKFQFDKNWGLYTGLYADLGLNNIVKDRQKDARLANNFVDYNYDNPANPVINSILTSNYGYVTNENGGVEHETVFVKRTHTLGFGIKAAVTIGWEPMPGKKSSCKKHDRKKAAQDKAAAQKAAEEADKLTPEKMAEILNRQTKELIDAQHKEFEDLKALIEKEDPELTTVIFGFDFNKDEILYGMYQELDARVNLLKKYPKAKIKIVGHTDEKGSNSYNYDLGLSRANAVKMYFVSKGIDANRISVDSKGKSQPLVKNANTITARYNRRVEFILQE